MGKKRGEAQISERSTYRDQTRLEDLSRLGFVVDRLLALVLVNEDSSSETLLTLFYAMVGEMQQEVAAQASAKLSEGQIKDIQESVRFDAEAVLLKMLRTWPAASEQFAEEVARRVGGGNSSRDHIVWSFVDHQQEVLHSIDPYKPLGEISQEARRSEPYEPVFFGTTSEFLAILAGLKVEHKREFPRLRKLARRKDKELERLAYGSDLRAVVSDNEDNFSQSGELLMSVIPYNPELLGKLELMETNVGKVPEEETWQDILDFIYWAESAADDQNWEKSYQAEFQNFSLLEQVLEGLQAAGILSAEKFPVESAVNILQKKMEYALVRSSFSPDELAQTQKRIQQDASVIIEYVGRNYEEMGPLYEAILQAAQPQSDDTEKGESADRRVFSLVHGIGNGIVHQHTRITWNTMKDVLGKEPR